MASGRGEGRRSTIRLAGAVLAGVIALGLSPATAQAAPPNPSDSDISAAQTAQQDASAQVGAISAQLAGAQASSDAASQQALIALQDYEDQQAAYEASQVAATAAAAVADQAAADVQVGRDQVADFARDSYMQGTTSAGTMALLTSGSVTEVLERAALLEAAGDHRGDVVVQLSALQDQADAADQAAQDAVDAAAEQEQQAAELLASAQAQEAAARSQADALAAQQETLQAQLLAAQQTLYGLQGARRAAEAYAAAQAAAAARPPARSTPVASAPSSSSSSSSSNSSSNSSSSSSSPAPAPSGGGTAGEGSASVAQAAIAAARTQLGVLYSWGGGGPNGPSYGISPDQSVYGFDCSGLMEYAYAQAGIRIGGTSRDQWYTNRGSQVDANDLQPGDLVFYASGSGYTSIYHVAMVIGGGKMIEAPDRGLTVRISNLRFGNQFYGAVRPSA